MRIKPLDGLIVERAPSLHVVVASTRPGRVGLPVAQWFEQVAREHGGFDVEVDDLAEIDLPLVDEPNHPRLRQYVHQHTRDWSARVDAAAAFVFVMPEYNFSITAPLKNAIDFVYHEWAYKPVGFVSYGGVSGGVRAVQMAKQVVTAVRMMPAGAAVAIPFVANLLDEERRLQASESMDVAAAAMLDELVLLERALRPLRHSAAPSS